MAESKGLGRWNADMRKVALGIGVLALVGIFAYGVMGLIGYLNGGSPEPIERIPKEPVLGSINKTVSTGNTNSPIVPDNWIGGTLMFNDGVILGVSYPREYFVLNPKRFGDEGPSEEHNFTRFFSYDTSLAQNNQIGVSANIRIAVANHADEPATVLSDYLTVNGLEAESVTEIDGRYVTGQRAVIADNAAGVKRASAVRVTESTGTMPRSFVVSLVYDEADWSAEDAQEISAVYDEFIRYLRIR